MTVSELIEALSEFPGDMRVIVGSDDEGNDWLNPYVPTASWCVEDETRCGYRPVANEDIGTEYDPGDCVQMVTL